jgi:hypothetical protein
MSDECLHFCKDGLIFPKRPANRPALDRIDYRIGAYAEFRAAMLARLNIQPVLLGWTHREPDDPGIALIEGAAILGDILTFYQDLYANEAYLRTAQWRESVAELVRLLGYRLAPGLGGRGRFAFEVKGALPVTIPAGFGIEVDLEGAEEPAEFETEKDFIAYPHLSRFHFYRPRIYGSFISGGASKVELAAVGGSSSPDVLKSADLKAGDRVMLLPDESMWSVNGTPFSPQAAPQIVKLTKVTRTLDRTILEFDGSLASSWIAPVRAYRVNRSFRHFGHNAPPKVVASQTDSSGKITGSTQGNTIFLRHFDWECGDASMSVALPERTMPLDQQVNDLSAGAKLIIQARVQFQSHSTIEPLVVVKTINSMRAANLGWGNLNGQSTFLTINSKLVTNSSTPGAQGDIRDVQFHEVTSPALELRRVASFSSGAQTAPSLQFFGTYAEVKALAGRGLILQHDDGRVIELACTDAANSFAPPSGADNVKMWTVHLDKAPAGFLKQDFDEAAPKATVFGNVTDATQGKTQREAALGNGDSRQTFQTFKLPKAPLTYHPSPGGTPPQAPELEIRVNAILWKRVDAFFGHGPKEEIYIVREDVKGDSFVQFGDGENGARLPSGVDNVTAYFRAGSGAHGNLKPGAKPQPGGRVDGLEKIQLPDVISGGGEPESGDKAREAAPGKVQSLGRLVSLRDFETETLGIAGVTKVAAAWALDGGVPAVVLTVLLEAGRESEINAVKHTIAEYQQCRGPNRFPVRVIQGALRYSYLDVQFAFDPRLKREDVEKQIRAALGVGGDEVAERRGLFTLKNRIFGGAEYATRITGYVQNAAGVRWCKVTALGLLPAGGDPAALTLPPEPKPLNAVVTCGDAEVLQVYPAHLKLTAAAPPPTDPCEP